MKLALAALLLAVPLAAQVPDKFPGSTYERSIPWSATPGADEGICSLGALGERSCDFTQPKPQSFFANRANRALVTADLNVRLLDALSTRQMLTNPCNCFHETGHFWGMFPLAPMASTTAGQFAWSTGMAAGNTLAAGLLWRHGEHSRHRKLYDLAARAVLAQDITVNAATGPIHNWTTRVK